MTKTLATADADAIMTDIIAFDIVAHSAGGAGSTTSEVEDE